MVVFIALCKNTTISKIPLFRCSFVPWLFQTSMSEALTLPVPGDILTVIVDFLYADDSPYVNSKC